LYSDILLIVPVCPYWHGRRPDSVLFATFWVKISQMAIRTEAIGTGSLGAAGA
jgi:hypothetical protein